MSTAQRELFAGKTYDPALDEERLTKLLGRVFELMRDGEWRTLAQIRERVGGSETGISAKLRDLRKARFGGYAVDARRADGGLWEYRLRNGNG